MVLWRIMQAGLAHLLSLDLAHANRSRYLCSWRILRKRLEGGGRIKLRKVQIKSRGKKKPMEIQCLRHGYRSIYF